MKNLFSLTILIMLIFGFFSEASAIPSFARKYSMSCKTCHSPVPSLKPYGDEFAGDGFVLKDQEAPRYYLETGDSELSLIRDVPLALRVDAYVTYNQDNLNKSDFNAPAVFKILSGGAITKDVAYYLYYILENGEHGKVEDVWIMFNNLFGTNLDFTIGQFQVSDPMFKRELRLTKDDYYIYKVKPALSNVDLTYDRGIMLNYGLETGTDLTLLIVNGNGIGPGISNIFDDDKHKNFVGRISQDIAQHLRIGAFGYYGKEDKMISTSLQSNSIQMFGGDATISVDPFELNFQYVERKDDNASFITNKFDSKTRGAFAELIFRPNADDSKWYGVALFNWIESDFNYLNLKQLGVHFGYLLKRNIRLVTEYSQNFSGKYSKMSVGVISAF